MISSDAKLRRPEDILSDALNVDRATLICSKHNYVAGSKHQQPRTGCADCIKVDFIHYIATKKGDLQANLDEFEALIHAMCELEDEGEFDFKVERPIMTIEKDAA